VSISPGVDTIPITVASNTGTGIQLNSSGDIKNIYISAPALAAYDVEILDSGDIPVWGESGITGGSALRSLSEKGIVVQNGYKVKLSNASNGAYTATVRRHV
jgi:hypothetical protein